ARLSCGMTDREFALLTLTCVQGLSGNDLTRAARLLPGEVGNLTDCGLPLDRDQLASLWSGEPERTAARIARQCSKLGAQLLYLDGPGYPYLLANSWTPPPVLYVKGNTDVFTSGLPSVAMV